ncbi:MAG TPA: aminotransferase class V-fold PLP-dependent enzyme, partial [Sporichthyaceae bacterium]
MTTPPPIADGFGPASFGGADGLPDEATINRWAAAFWSPDPGFYFLNSASTYTAAAPAHPSVGEAWLPSLGLLSTHAPAPQAGAPAPLGFYFINEAIPAGFEVPNLPLDPHPAFDVHAVRRDFPILSETVHGKPLIWLDNAATTQKPQAVIDRLAYFYAHENSNIHRSAHAMAARATDAYESARSTVARFLGAGSADEIVFVRGATEGINLVAKAWGFRHIKAGDEIVISHLEHHANIVPWQMLAERVGASIKVIPVDDSGQILLDAYTDLLSDRTKIVAITQVSNALGTIVPVERVIEL